MTALQLLTELLDQFEDDPIDGWIHYPLSQTDEPVIVSEELQEILDRVNDYLFRTEDDIDEYTGGPGYPTEEVE